MFQTATSFISVTPLKHHRNELDCEIQLTAQFRFDEISHYNVGFYSCLTPYELDAIESTPTYSLPSSFLYTCFWADVSFSDSTLDC